MSEPRVVEDEFGVHWKCEAGFLWRVRAGGEWWERADSAGSAVTPERVRLWADLLANPHETEPA